MNVTYCVICCKRLDRPQDAWGPRREWRTRDGEQRAHVTQLNRDGWYCRECMDAIEERPAHQGVLA